MVTVATSFEAPIKGKHWEIITFKRVIHIDTYWLINLVNDSYTKLKSIYESLPCHTFETNIFINKLFQIPYLSVIFPMDFLEHGINGKNFAMLGLGDIVIPG